jgi:RNA polymerase sigma factor (sigma-70 family)
VDIVVSEAFASVYPKWAARRVRTFGPYLQRSVVNNVNRTLRRRRRDRSEEQRTRGDDRGSLGMDDRLGEHDAMCQALRQLSTKQRTAVVLHYYEDRPVDEVARIMGTSVGTAKAHLSRGRDTLRKIFSEDRP